MPAVRELPAAQPPVSAKPKPPEPVRVETVAVQNDRSVFVLRGAKGKAAGVFLHGLCGHGLGYLQSFQHAAARHGRWIAPHGDVACGSGGYRSWSGKLGAMQDQILAGLREAGVSEPKRITLVGYSLGATRALALSQKYPAVYDELVLIAAPNTPSPAGQEHIRAAVMMSGERDRQDHMKAASRAFERAGIPSTFIELPGAAHGQMGSAPERVMGEALEWLSRARARGNHRDR